MSHTTLETTSKPDGVERSNGSHPAALCAAHCMSSVVQRRCDCFTSRPPCACSGTSHVSLESHRDYSGRAACCKWVESSLTLRDMQSGQVMQWFPRQQHDQTSDFAELLGINACGMHFRQPVNCHQLPTPLERFFIRVYNTKVHIFDAYFVTAVSHSIIAC